MSVGSTIFHGLATQTAGVHLRHNAKVNAVNEMGDLSVQEVVLSAVDVRVNCQLGEAEQKKKKKKNENRRWRRLGLSLEFK